MALEPGIMLRPWGGERLSGLFDVSLPEGKKLGETWNISIHPDAPSLWEQRPLSEQVSDEQMPYLVKLIDTADNLSIQVHPDDRFAKKFENARGKSECWLILDAGPEGGIHLGLRPEVSRESFERLLREGRDISACLNFRKVAAGDFFYVPAGTLHSIGKDVFLVEVQQNSGITYRVWDWRRRGRELHIDKAMQVANFIREGNSEAYFQVKRNLFQAQGPVVLLEHPQFHLTLYNLAKGQTCSLLPKKGRRLSSLMVLSGEGILGNSPKKLDVYPFQSYLLKEKVVMEGKSHLSFIFVC